MVSWEKSEHAWPALNDTLSKWAKTTTKDDATMQTMMTQNSDYANCLQVIRNKTQQNLESIRNEQATTQNETMKLITKMTTQYTNEVQNISSCITPWKITCTCLLMRLMLSIQSGLKSANLVPALPQDLHQQMEQAAAMPPVPPPPPIQQQLLQWQ